MRLLFATLFFLPHVLFAGQWINVEAQSPNCQVWLVGSKPYEKIEWSGSCKQGKAHGNGELSVLFPDHIAIIKSRFEHGHVKGEVQRRDYMLVGEISSALDENQKPTGMGKLTLSPRYCANRAGKCLKEFNGTFKNGKVHEGRANFYDGDTYSGAFDSQGNPVGPTDSQRRTQRSLEAFSETVRKAREAFAEDPSYLNHELINVPVY